MTVVIREMTSADERLVIQAAELFDHHPSDTWTGEFLADHGHHLLIAYVSGEPAGFVSGIVVRHPDKGPEMLLYELGVDDAFRRRGIGTALVSELRDLARRLGHRSMWVVIDAGDDIAAATYRSAGAMTTEPAEILSWELT
ncbi:MAG: GNAT family N-acetyltransferase [Acidimicrobiia bacterium]|nr:GNAT family N-acetyltransferase [Acidimicrobiia bacterium]